MSCILAGITEKPLPSLPLGKGEERRGYNWGEMKKVKIVIQEDKLLIDSPILDEEVGGLGLGKQGLAVAGELNIGRSGNPVTIFIEDEETGEVLEVNHVQSALLLIEDQRTASSGWLSLAIGSIEKVSDVLEFLTRTTLDGLRKLTKR